MLKDTTWKLKTSECSSVIGFENLSKIVSLCGFQNIWSCSIFVTMLIHSWLLFSFIACWLAISAEMSLKSIYLISLNQIPRISFFFKLLHQIKSKGVWIGRTCLPLRRSCWLFKENPQVSEFLGCICFWWIECIVCRAILLVVFVDAFY
jgi:hypothetical protein